MQCMMDYEYSSLVHFLTLKHKTLNSLREKENKWLQNQSIKRAPMLILTSQLRHFETFLALYSLKRNLDGDHC